MVEFVLADAGPAFAAKTKTDTRMATKAAMDARFNGHIGHNRLFIHKVILDIMDNYKQM